MTQLRPSWQRAAYALAAMATVASAPARAQPQPSYQNLVAAKQLIVALESRVQNLIAKAQGGAGNSCERVDSERCRQPGRGRGPRVANLPEAADSVLDGDGADSDVQENDTAAELALEGMGHELFELGQLVDNATANYGNAAFWTYWQQACKKDDHLIVGNQAAKVAAILPAQGFITPADFDPNDQELKAVRAQLFCP